MNPKKPSILPGGFLAQNLLRMGLKGYKELAWHHALMPRQLKVQMSKVCNLRCRGCYRDMDWNSSKEPGGPFMTLETLEKALEGTSIRLLTSSETGEVFCNPYLKSIVGSLHKRGIRFAYCSNGTLINEEMADFLKTTEAVQVTISFTGATKSTFESSRLGANFDEVVLNAKRLTRLGIPLQINYVLLNEAVIEEIPQLMELSRSLGVYGILFLYLQTPSESFMSRPDYTKYSNLLSYAEKKAKDYGVSLFGKLGHSPRAVRCLDPFLAPSLLINGDIYACCDLANMKPGETFLGKSIEVPFRNYCMGNIHRESLGSIWKSGSYKELRKLLRDTNRSRPKPGELLDARDLNSKQGRFDFCRVCIVRWRR